MHLNNLNALVLSVLTYCAFVGLNNKLIFFYDYAHVLYIHSIRIIEHYVRTHTRLPVLVAAASTVFVGYLQAWLVETSESWKSVMLVLLQGF